MHAETIKIDYRGTFGIFGNVGTINNIIDQNTSNYKITTTVKLAGLAKMLLKGQKEFYLSRGHMENGLMVSDYYRMTTLKKGKKVVKEYFIDHIHKKTMKHYRKWKNGKLVKDEKKDLGFYAKDDLLTLYFNMEKHLKGHKDKVHFYIKAVGLEKQKGIVEISVPTPKTLRIYQSILGKKAKWYAKALIVQKNFKHRKGDIYLAGAKDGYIKKAVIKDILMYGDAKLVRIR